MDPNDKKEADMVVDVSNDVAASEARAAEAAKHPEPTAAELDAAAAKKVADAAAEAATDAPELDAEGRPVAKKQTADERIAELVKRAKDAEKIAFDLEMKAIAAEKERLAAAPITPEGASVEPDPKDFVYGEVDTEYLNAVVEHRVSVKLAKSREEFEASKKVDSERQVQASYRTKVEDTMVAGAKAHKDFTDVVSNASFDGHLARLVVDSDDAVDIAYHLGNNADELLKVTRAGPEERARIIGRLEGRFSATSAARKKTTNAPKPIGKGQQAAPTDSEAQYGPSNQDDFDKALFG